MDTATDSTTETKSTGDGDKEREPIVFKLTNDTLYPSKPHTFELSLPASSTLKDLRTLICETLDYQPEWFNLNVKMTTTLQDSDYDKTFEELFPQIVNGRVSLRMTRAPGCEQATQSNENLAGKFMSEKVKQMIPGTTPTVKHEPQSAIRPSTSTALVTTTHIPVTTTYSNWNSKSDTGYVGLSNQGATCYLNSLIQTLFMTPEFRAAIYQWSWPKYSHHLFQQKMAQKQLKDKEGKEAKVSKEAKEHNEGEPHVELSPDEIYHKWLQKMEETCIPLQLQKLFLQLQLSDSRAAETRNLTKSFSWKSTEAFTQHDVQELCRVLFDALENVWKGTEQNNLINELYQGEMKDYVKCLECNYEGSRVDKFLDIPLVIKGFGETEAVSSIEEALWKFVQTETLTGDNQFMCDKCNKKVDARKGLKLIKFPYLLTLQLKRFDFDFQYMRRIKLNDYVSFPEILDMNVYVNADAPRGGVRAEQEHADDDGHAGGEMDIEADPEEDPESAGLDLHERNKLKRQRLIQKALANGPYVYELFSVLIHRGSALGGHYYAYIKSFREGKWFDFNDSSVSSIDDDRYKETFGETSRSTSMWSGGTNAYMLMYRQYDPVRNAVETSKEDIPEAMRQVFEEDNKIEEEKKQAKERKRQMITLKVYYNDQVKPFEVHQDETFEATTNMVAQALGLSSYLPHNLRLRDLSHTDMPGRVYTPEQSKKSLNDLHFYYRKNLMIETKKDGEEFPEYNPLDLILKVSVFDKTSNSWSAHEIVSVAGPAKIGDLKAALEAKFHIPREQQVICKDDWDDRVVIYSNDDDSLKHDCHFWEGTKLWVEPAFTEEEILKAEEAETTTTTTSTEDTNGRKSKTPPPRAALEIQRVKNTIEVTFSSPDSQDEYKVNISKKCSLLELRNLIATKLKLDLDEFKLLKGFGNYKTELRDEESTLAELHIINSPLTVERGKPMRHGEIEIKWKVFVPNSPKQMDFLFKYGIPGKLTIKEAKVELVKHFEELQKNEATKRKEEPTSLGDPQNLRLREIFYGAPSTVCMDHMLVKDVVGARAAYSTPELIVQILPPGKTETKTSTDQVTIFLQQFHPDTFTLGERFEFETRDDEKLAVFCQRIKDATNIESLSLINADNWDGPSLLAMPKLNWIQVKEKEEEDSRRYYYSHDLKYEPNRTVQSWRLSDGDLLFFKDNQVPTKELSDEEIKKIKEEEERKRLLKAKATNYSSREESLVIKQADVAIDDV